MTKHVSGETIQKDAAQLAELREEGTESAQHKAEQIVSRDPQALEQAIVNDQQDVEEAGLDDVSQDISGIDDDAED